MAKTTKHMSAEAGSSGAKAVNRKTTHRKAAAKKVSAKPPKAKATASTEKPMAKKSVAAKTVPRKASSKTPETKKTASTEKTKPKDSDPSKTVERKSVPRKKVAAGAVVHRQISSAERCRMIAEAAYLRGESQGFLSNEQEDWLLAEAEVDSLLIRAGVIVND
jgi:hypothetical protein